MRRTPTFQEKQLALDDIWAFADLINYRGGRDGFSKFHYELTDFLCQPQKLEDNTTRRRLILAPRGHFKAQSLTTPVLTPQGFVPLGSIEVGADVIGSDGLPQKVTHTHPISEMDLYRVTTSDGRSTLCNAEHLWEVSSSDWNGKVKVKSTQDLLKNFARPRYDKRYGTYSDENHYRLRNVAVQGTEQNLSIDPYTLGVWLGDGTCGASTITCHDDDNEVMRSIGAYKNEAGVYRWTVPGLITLLKKEGLDKKKDIPEAYFLGTTEQRLALLQGLMDSDGTCHVKHGQVSFVNTNEVLVNAVTRLTRSLGGTATENWYVYEDKPFASVTINLNLCPFRLQRKVDRWKPNDKGYVYIKDITLETRALGRCITVSNTDGLFVTQDYLLTHNSSVCSVLYVMWRVYRNPDIRILVAANLKRLSKAFIRELRQYFEDKWLQDNVWNARPHIAGVLIPALSASDRRKRNATRSDDDSEATDGKLIWSMEALQVIRPTYMKEPSIQTVSIGTTVTGDHYDLLILDDIIDFSNSDTEDKAENILDWTRDLESVLDPRMEHTYEYTVGKHQETFTDFTGDESLTLGTRYFKWDFYGYLLENEELLGHISFVRNIFVNSEDDTDGYIFPERFSAEVLDNIRRRLNSFRRFASQYLNRIVSSDEQMLPKENIQYFMIQGVDIGDDGYINVNLGLGRRVRVRPLLVVDPAVSQKATADNTVLTVAGYDDSKELYVFDMRVGRFTPSETIKHLFELAEKWKLNAVTVETVGGFGLLAPIIKDNFVKYNKVLAVREYKPRGEKKARILTHLEPQWENKTIHMVNTLSSLAVLNDELDAFPLGKDDCVDTLAIVCEIGTPTRREGTRRAYNPRKTTNSRYGGVR